MSDTAPSGPHNHDDNVDGTQADQEDAPESTYQAQFDTVAGEWATLSLPWHEFVPVKRAQVRSRQGRMRGVSAQSHCDPAADEYTVQSATVIWS